MKLIGLLLLVAVAVAAPAPEIRFFRFERPVQVAQDTTGETCAVLDAKSFTHASPGLADLRLYRGNEETPFAVHDALTKQSAAATIEPINLGRRGGKTVFDAEMPDGSYSDLQLSVTGQNFIATVNVSGSQTLAGAVTHIGSYTIFDFTSQRLGRSTVVHIPKSNFRYLHFEIAGLAGPEHIKGVVAASAPKSEQRYITVTDQVRFTQQGRDSVAEFTTPAQVPVDRMVFTPTATPVNFSRRVDIEASRTPSSGDDSGQGREIPTEAFGDLLRIHRELEGHLVNEERLTIDVPEPFFSTPVKWKVTVHNEDDAPIEFSSVVLRMRERDLCFDAAAGAAYTVYYGDRVLSAPHYDYASWFSPQEGPPSSSLGPEQVNAAFEVRPDSRPFTEKHPALLWVVLILVVLLLGGIALRTAKRVGPPTPMP